MEPFRGSIKVLAPSTGSRGVRFRPRLHISRQGSCSREVDHWTARRWQSGKLQLRSSLGNECPARGIWRQLASRPLLLGSSTLHTSTAPVQYHKDTISQPSHHSRFARAQLGIICSFPKRPHSSSKSRVEAVATYLLHIFPSSTTYLPLSTYQQSGHIPIANHHARLPDRRQGRRRRHRPPNSGQATSMFGSSSQGTRQVLISPSDARLSSHPSSCPPTSPRAPLSTSPLPATLPQKPKPNAPSAPSKTRSSTPSVLPSPRLPICAVAMPPRPALSSSGTPSISQPPT